MDDTCNTTQIRKNYASVLDSFNTMIKLSLQSKVCKKKIIEETYKHHKQRRVPTQMT